jgi:spore coat polysaccharide biosynthesis protein SpsF (cytidylyltransferase family)
MSDYTFIVQARMSSTRLPGKVLSNLAGMTLLDQVVKRLKSFSVDHQIIIASSDSPSDKAIEEHCRKMNYDFFAGDLSDVLSRYYQCAKKYEAKNVIRVTADCPLVNSKLISQAIEIHRSEGLDYITNVRPPTFPDGLDFSIFTFELLEAAFKNAKLLSEREHVVPWMWTQCDADLIRWKNVKAKTDLSELRWTVDYQADLEFIDRVITALNKKYGDNWDSELGYVEMAEFISKQEGLADNGPKPIRDEGLAKSISLDQKNGEDS